jgi:quinoprotein glucose dehydrogenase
MRALTLSCLFLAGSLIAADERSFNTWSTFLGGADSSQYSSLKQINKGNVKQLEVAWSYPTGNGSFIFSPIVVDGVMYVLRAGAPPPAAAAGQPPARGGGGGTAIAALDAATGKEMWTHPNPGPVSARGINYWQSKDGSDRRLLYASGGFLTAVNAKTGETIMSFGDNGRTDLKVGLDRDLTNIRSTQSNDPGRIYDNIIVMTLTPVNAGDAYSATPGDIHAYDVVTGKMLWVFHTVPHPGEPGYETWPKDAWKTQGGVHNWNEMTVDEKRGIIYIPLGTARYDFYGPDRHGQDLYGNSLVALDARTGKRLWHFQTVHHDLWDYDLPTAPKLLTVKHDGKDVDIVAQPTKQGFLFVFNRVTGEPLWPIEERKVPQSDVPGEESWPTQPFPTKPPPFARQSFTEKDINPYLTDDEKAQVKTMLQTWRNEGLFTPPSLKGTVQIPGNNGGANWGSSAVDPTNGTMYIVSKELPMGLTLSVPAAGGRGGGRGRGGAPGGAAAPGAAPEAAAGPPAAPAPAAPTLGEGGFIHYNSNYNFMLQRTNGLSAIGPPWGQITAYDLNTGTIKWQIPDGGVTALAAQGHSDTGSQFPRGGPVVTAGGLVFIASDSDRKIRAYDEDNGKVLWEADLPSAADGVPAVYEVNGREYLALCAAQNYGLMPPRLTPAGPAPPGAYIVYALPQK